MRKLLLTTLSLLAVLALLAACGPTPTEAPATEEAAPAAPVEEEFQVGLVTDVGKVNDGTFNEYAYTGMMQAADEFGLENAYIETQQPTDYEKNVEQFVDEGFDMIVTVGFMIGETTQKEAEANPGINFTIVDFAYDPAIPNVMGLVFREDQAGFMAGALAGLMSESKTVGIVAGMEIPPVVKFRNGYENGVAYTCPDCTVIGVYIDSFTDPARGKAAAESQIAEGADVIFGAGGPTGSGGILGAAQQGVWVIGVDQDEYFTTFKGGEEAGADKLLSSAMKRVDVAVYTAVKAAYEGTFEGHTAVFDAAVNGVGLAPFHDTEDAVPDDVKAKLDEVFGMLAAGSLDTGVDPVSGAMLGAAAEAEAPDPCDYGGEFLSIEALDDSTVKFTLCYPDPAFPSKIAFSAFPINDTAYLEETGGGGDIVDNPIGTGPYMVENWNRGSELVMTRFDDYWGDPAIAKTLIFRWNSEAAARLVELQAGTIDGMDNPGSDDFSVIEDDANLALYERPGTNIFYLGMNNWYEPFDNERVRQAFAMAIDKQRIVDNFYPRGSLAAGQFMPPVIFGYTPEVEWWEYDPDMAKQILEEEGVLPGFETTITYRDVVRSYLPEPGVVAQDFQAQMAAIGVTVEIVVMESGAFLDASDAGEVDGFHMLGWGADYPDATNFLDFHFGKGASAQFGDGWEDIWDALNRGGALADPDDRYPIYIEANELIKQHVPMIPIAHGGSGCAYQADVAGAHSSPLGNEYFAVMTPGDRDQFVWMQNAEPIGLYCPDETDGESLRPCEQIHEPLLGYEVGGAAVVPALATGCDASDDLTEWTCHLREGVKFHNGATLDADDVVLSYVVQWDAAHPLHVGRDGNFTYFNADFGAFLNAE